MREIAVLDQLTIDKIAAGEVVERPASVVKELMENSIDAGASAVSVEIRDGGMVFLRVTDNGSGIPVSELRLAFCRHATSKIRRAEDLLQVASLGFRGEALSSIAAVSRTECVSRVPEEILGARIQIEGGRERSFEEVGAPAGTTITVRDLFYNTPARAKFLRTPTAEANRVSAVVEEIALSHPEISFKYVQNGQDRLFTSGNGNLQEIIYQIFGRDVAAALLPVRYTGDGLSLHGYIGAPSLSRGNRQFENYFANGRSIRSTLIERAIEDGFRGFLMQHRYPFALLYLELEGSTIDVNVHPNKLEVRFSDQEMIYRSIFTAVRQALLEQEQIPEVRENKKTEPVRTTVLRAPEPFETGRTAALLAEKREPQIPDSVVPSQESPARTGNAAVAEQQTLFTDSFLGAAARDQTRMIGQLFATYWLIEYQDSLFLVDQHAAHEKVLYERLLRKYHAKEIVSQMLYPSLVLHPGRKESELLRLHLDDFAAFGFEIEPFGGDSFKVSAVPAELYSLASEDALREIVDHLEEIGAEDPVQIIEKLASAACRAAVKGHDRISEREMHHLIEEMLTLEDPYHCPHGRPTVIRMSRREIERQFGRVQ